MSRRRGEFEHRTSIFEGAFRAWSHLGGLDPEDLETKPPTDMDPLTYPLVHDPRLSGKPIKNPDGTLRREYPYEPLPRSGLSHPYVQAILSPWLGPDADNEAIQLGLTTLRTWWQHRRKGESGSAIAALGTEKMKGVVEGYTRHFFTLAHCIVVNDRVQPPRGLHAKMRELEKINTKRKKKGEEPISMAAVAAQNNTGGTNGNINGNNNNPMNALQGDLSDPNLTPLEKLHVAQRRQLESSGMLPTSAGGTMPLPDISSNPGMIMDMKGKCVPGKVNLPDVVNQVTLRANQFVHRGAGAMGGSSSNADGKNLNQQRGMFGDPNTTPVVFVSAKGDIQIAMKVDGITCAHCVKIVETVLRGCNGNPSPILGLLDAAADRDLHSVLIKIDKASNAKRIAFEAARNLSMVGYTAEPKEMSIVGAGADPRTHMDLGALSTAFEVVAHTESQDVFDWTIPCTCPDNGVLRGDCSRHSQMNTRIFDAFAAREQQVTEYMAGCAMKYGMDCTCGPSCRCKNCPIHSAPQQQQQQQQAQADTRGVNNANGTMASSGMSSNFQNDEPALRVDQQMMFNNFDMRPPAANASPTTSLNPIPFNMAQMSQFPDLAQQQQQQHHHQQQQQHQQQQHHQQQQQQQHQQQQQQHHQQQQQQHHQQQHPSQPHHQQRMSGRVAQRNPSTTIRGMSITSETTFGRAMSGLSALSIDWENLDDFDLEIDHSAHINGNAPPAGRRRSSARRSIMSTGSNDGGSSGTQVSFRV